MFIQPKTEGLSYADLFSTAHRSRSPSPFFPYTKEVCRCRYCAYCQEGKCSLNECCCMTERVKAHSCTFAEILNHCFSNVKDGVFRYRLRIAAERATMEKSCFLDKEHRSRFNKALSMTRRQDYLFIAQLYILTATEKLWEAAENKVYKDGIRYFSMSFHNLGENGYTFYSAAYDLENGSSHTYAGRIYEDNGEIATFLTIEQELNSAMKKIKELSDENGWNISKAATHGYSSGSHLAALYAYNSGHRKDAPIPVVFTFSMVGPMSFYIDFWQAKSMPIGPQIAGIGLNDADLFTVPDGNVELMQLLQEVNEGKKPRSVINAYDFTTYDKATYESKIDSISPLSFVKKGNAVPTILAEAGMDKFLISENHGLEMEKALTDKEIDHKVIIFPNSDHMGAGNEECGNVYRRYQKIYMKKYFGY